MKSEWKVYSLDEIAEFNPRESIKKGTVAKKISMDKLKPFCRDIPEYELQNFSGGAKFRNGDTIMARITPCLENGKTAIVNILDDGEVGFGSTEYIVFRAKKGITDADFLYYLVCSPLVREPAIKSMVGSSGRQRVQTDVVQRLEVALPSLHEQQEMAEILKMLDDKIALNNAINNNLPQATSRAKPRRHRPLGACSQMGVWRCGFIGRQPDNK
jgi:type I restriction enzyme S subunit